MRVRYLDRETVVSTLRRLVTEVGAAHPDVVEIRLFGSLSRGERNPFADADLLLVLDESEVPFHERAPRYKPTGSPVPMDLTVCTRAELDRERAAGNRFVQRILAESIVLYSRG